MRTIATFAETHKKASKNGSDLEAYPITSVSLLEKNGKLQLKADLGDTAKSPDLIEDSLSSYMTMKSLDGKKPPSFSYKVGSDGLTIENDISAALKALVTLKLLHEETAETIKAKHPEITLDESEAAPESNRLTLP